MFSTAIIPCSHRARHTPPRHARRISTSDPRYERNGLRIRNSPVHALDGRRPGSRQAPESVVLVMKNRHELGTGSLAGAVVVVGLLMLAGRLIHRPEPRPPYLEHARGAPAWSSSWPNRLRASTSSFRKAWIVGVMTSPPRAAKRERLELDSRMRRGGLCGLPR